MVSAFAQKACLIMVKGVRLQSSVQSANSEKIMFALIVTGLAPSVLKKLETALFAMELATKFGEPTVTARSINTNLAIGSVLTFQLVKKVGPTTKTRTSVITSQLAKMVGFTTRALMSVIKFQHATRVGITMRPQMSVIKFQLAKRVGLMTRPLMSVIKMSQLAAKITSTRMRVEFVLIAIKVVLAVTPQLASSALLATK